MNSSNKEAQEKRKKNRFTLFQDRLIPAPDILDLSTCASYYHHLYNMMQPLKSLLLMLLLKMATYVHNNSQTKYLALIPNNILEGCNEFPALLKKSRKYTHLP